MKNPTFIDLFCGIGGFRLGLQKTEQDVFLALIMILIVARFT